MSVNGMLKKSRYYPKIEDVRGINIDYYPVVPELIEFDEFDSFKLVDTTRKAIEYVVERTETEKVEYTIVFYGELKLDTSLLDSYVFERGGQNSAKYSAYQIHQVIATKKNHIGRVVYGHTHVSNTKDYNCFSMRDLRFIVEKAYESGDDEYALLATKDGIFCIKYDIGKEEFFRIKIS